MAGVGRSFSQIKNLVLCKPSVYRRSFLAVGSRRIRPLFPGSRSDASLFALSVRGIVSASVRGKMGGGLHPSRSGKGVVQNDGDDGRQMVAFPLSSSCILKLQRGDITKWSVDGVSDAIVNAANERMLGGGGVDGAIHRAAGPKLLEACWDVPEVRPGVRCPTGEARITGAYLLPVSRVIHTVGPVYDIDDHPEASLRSAYRSCLRTAKGSSIQYIAFPAISCGIYRYPLSEASSIAISTVKEFADDFKEVHFVLFSDDAYNAWLDKAHEIL